MPPISGKVTHFFVFCLVLSENFRIFAPKKLKCMGILAALYSMLGLGTAAYAGGSWLGSIFKKEMSDEEFYKWYREEEEKRNAARKR